MHISKIISKSFILLSYLTKFASTNAQPGQHFAVKASPFALESAVRTTTQTEQQNIKRCQLPKSFSNINTLRS